jgi:hypothetical protein
MDRAAEGRVCFTECRIEIGRNSERKWRRLQKGQKAPDDKSLNRLVERVQRNEKCSETEIFRSTRNIGRGSAAH